MPSPYYGLGFAALALGALGLVFALREPSRAPAPRAQDAPPATIPTEMSRELAVLRAEVAALKAQPRSSTATPVDPAPPAALPPPSPPTPVTPEAARAHFDEVIESEPWDPAWAREEERSIGAFVREEAGDGAALESVSCRSSMCRLRVRFADDGGREAFKLKIGLPPLNNGGFYQDEGEGRLVFFAAREGHPLPQVPGS
ncbi:MAG: hypothetical protein K0R38_2133 [Polyangiaceae bacterium]|jgi:hypothetical protein|nr:hypothetical protein [Polyangiaceae bacterium]